MTPTVTAQAREHGRVWVTVHVGGTASLTPDQARALARDLMTQANRAEGIAADRQPLCPSCGVGMRRPHDHHCAVARCTTTGVRVVDCPISHSHDEDPDIWTGTVQAPTPHPGVDL